MFCGCEKSSLALRLDAIVVPKINDPSQLPCAKPLRRCLSANAFVIVMLLHYATESLVSLVRNVDESVRVSCKCLQCLRAHRHYVGMVCEGFYWCERRRMMDRLERDMVLYSRIFTRKAEPIRYRRLATSTAW